MPNERIDKIADLFMGVLDYLRGACVFDSEIVESHNFYMIFST